MSAISETSALAKGAVAAQEPRVTQEQELSEYSGQVKKHGVSNPEMEKLANPSELFTEILGSAEFYIDNSTAQLESLRGSDYAAAYYDNHSTSFRGQGYGPDQGLGQRHGLFPASTGMSLSHSLNSHDENYRPLARKMMLSSAKFATQSALIGTTVGNFAASINALIKGQ